jgi:radical SAM superfamily enzyme YgiQ (UPF0313 family)
MYATYLKNNGYKVKWNSDKGDRVIQSENDITVSFLELPQADRILTKAKDKIWQNNGNFKYNPATYILSASGCWWGKCSFCVEQFNKYEVRKPIDVVRELKSCQDLRFKEVFDDSATLPIGEWLDEYLGLIKDHRIKLVLGCNMRLVDAPYRKLKQAGFRMVLFGLESSNQYTLDRINKGIKDTDYEYIIKASKEGLEPHIAIMLGYPWKDSDLNTIRLAKYLLINGYAKTAQVSIYNPPYADLAFRNKSTKHLRDIYSVALSPKFWFNKFKDLKSLDDLKYLWKGIKSYWR